MFTAAARSETPTSDPSDAAGRLLFKLQASGIAVTGIVPYCGSESALGQPDIPGWGGWVGRETTADQRRIEKFLVEVAKPADRILHVGIGNSSLAEMLSPRVRGILGITVDAAEAAHATSLGLANYSVEVLNKYSVDMEKLAGPFDFVVDNNPATYACCLYHFCRMMMSYRSHLAPGGAIVTADPGLGMIVSGDSPAWSLDAESWRRLGGLLDLEPRTVRPLVYGLYEGERGAGKGEAEAQAELPTTDTLESLAARVAHLQSELWSTRDQFNALMDEAGGLDGPVSLKESLLGFFSVWPGPKDFAVTAPTTASRGARIAVEPGMRLTATVQARSPFDKRPPGYHQSVLLSFVGRGWFALEFSMGFGDFCGATGYQLAMNLQINRPVPARFVLRYWRGDEQVDVAVTKINLYPQERNYMARGRIELPSRDEGLGIRSAVMLLIFETGPRLALQMDYLNAYFS